MAYQRWAPALVQIFMAKEVRDSVVGETKQSILSVMDIAIVRNAFGRQRDPFKLDIEVKEFGKLRAVFIRAPAIVRVWGEAKPIAKLKHPRAGEVIVAAQVMIGYTHYVGVAPRVVHHPFNSMP